MRVTVTFLGIIRDQVGSRSLDFELPSGATLRDLFDALAPQLEGRLADWVWDHEKRMFTEEGDGIAQLGAGRQRRSDDSGRRRRDTCVPPHRGGLSA